MANKVPEFTTKKDFDSFINGNEKVLVDFYAEWCGPCKIAPKVEILAEEFRSFAFCKVNVDKMEKVVTDEEYEVFGLPTFMIFVNGKQAATVVGSGEADLRKALNKHK